MLEWIDRTDAAVHGLCTKFSHWLQRTMGLTCYFIARIGVGLTAINVLAEIINYYFPFLPSPTTLVMLVCSVLILISCIPRSIECQKGEESIGRNVKSAEFMRYMNGAFWRVLWVGFAIFNLPFVFLHPAHIVASFLQDGAFSLGCALFYNFINVTPLPPGTSKVREWIRGLFSTPELAKQENN